MIKTRKQIISAIFFAGLSCGVMRAETLSVLPAGYNTVDLGKTFQFTAQGTGGAAVTWSVAGIAGGNATLGIINTSGLYTAPAVVPASGQMAIKAVITGSMLSATTYIYVLPAGPSITSITPNPLAGGTINITIQGTGFLAGATVMCGAVQMSTTSITPTTIKASTWIAPGITSVAFSVRNSGSSYGNTVIVPISGNPADVKPATVSPVKATVSLNGTQQFTATGNTGWTALAGTITAAGLYTAPSVMPASGADTITAVSANGNGTAAVTLVSNIPPAITSISTSPLPLGVFSTSVTGSGFNSSSAAQLSGVALTVTYQSPTTITMSGFAGPLTTGTLTVANGALVSSPFTVNIGVQSPVVSVSAARRFLEQAAFGPTPQEAAHVQTVGFAAWIAEQMAMPMTSNFNVVTGSQGNMAVTFLANAVTNPDQLRQRIAFALSQIFVVSMNKLIWTTTMVPYQEMLMADAFTNYRKILGDVTLSPAMGLYLDMANNAKANPAANTAANENFAREVMQLFAMGDVMLNQDGTIQVDANGAHIPAYLQADIAEMSRVFTGWTYAPAPGKPLGWNTYLNTPTMQMVPYTAMHDFGPKTLLNGYPAQANISPLADVQGALDNIAGHSNVAPFISKQLIQHLVKSNPSPAYVSRVAQVFTQYSGDMAKVVTAILLDQEARANDEGGNDQVSDGHLQEPALFVPALVRAFSGQMTIANYYSSSLVELGQDLYNPASVFNYYSPSYTVNGTGGLKGPEFQIANPNVAILRENLISQFFSQYSNPVASNGPGTVVDLTPFLPLATNPQALVKALDVTLTHGTMPAPMNTIVTNAVTADLGGNLRRVQTACYLILMSSYYNVWH